MMSQPSRESVFTPGYWEPSLDVDPEDLSIIRRGLLAFRDWGERRETSTRHIAVEKRLEWMGGRLVDGVVAPIRVTAGEQIGGPDDNTYATHGESLLGESLVIDREEAVFGTQEDRTPSKWVFESDPIKILLNTMSSPDNKTPNQEATVLTPYEGVFANSKGIYKRTIDLVVFSQVAGQELTCHALRSWQNTPGKPEVSFRLHHFSPGVVGLSHKKPSGTPHYSRIREAFVL